MTDEFVILVDAHDRELGIMEKMEAHRKGILHRAFSVLVFNSKGELLLQKRAESKYHSGGLWTNTCCSHPRPGESIAHAASRRLQEEMGITLDLKTVGSFTYQVKLDKNLIEHELDHVFVGNFNDAPCINNSEVADWKFISIENLEHDLAVHPGQYTEWFKIIINTWDIRSISQPRAL